MGKRSGTFVEHGEEITGLTVRMIHKELFLATMTASFDPQGNQYGGD